MRNPQALSSSRLTRVLGWSALAALALNTWWGLWLSPPDVVQGQFVRMLYVHPAVATMCYAGFGLCTLASLAWLWPRLRSPRWDRLAVAGAEVGAVFCLATLVTGSIWGRASWGVWWTWDARLTLTAILFALSLGYLALRRAVDNPHSRALVSSMVALLMALTVVVDHYATSWWVTLHQNTTLFKQDPTVHGWQLATMLVSCCTVTGSRCSRNAMRPKAWRPRSRLVAPRPPLPSTSAPASRATEVLRGPQPKRSPSELRHCRLGRQRHDIAGVRGAHGAA